MKGVVKPHAIPIRTKPRMYLKMEVGEVSGGVIVVVVVVVMIAFSLGCVTTVSLAECGWRVKKCQGRDVQSDYSVAAIWML